MRPAKFVFVSLALLLLGISFEGRAAQRKPEAAPMYIAKGAAIHLVATNEIAAQLSVGDARERITGRVSFHMVTTPEGQVAVRGLNVVFFGVSQKLLAGRAHTQEPLGVLGFAVVPSMAQTLRYDAKTRRISGDLRMFADASFLSAFARPTGDKKGDLFETPTLPATARIALDLDAALPERGEEYQRVPAKLDVRLHAEPARYEKFEFPAFEVQLLEPAVLHMEFGWIPFFEVARRLCVQPVRLLNFRWHGWFPLFQLSGAGLPFGEPGARTQWAKADVVFDIRDWKTLFASAYWVMDSSEANALRALVDDDDCIEVFFVYDFDPEDLWGGGATWGSGTASAQIISSDANARYGIDLTHLAHEFGHVLGLLHPGSSSTASAAPASSGTLMCPSGFRNDNPRVNSQENEDLLSNPLLTFALKLRTAGPDCIDSADCGKCP